ncbi:hypothetical protein FDP41_010966 [Naegleria fowleri]|uniref:RGS domain-containing protein n=1 Tax=Naegleria fowleri TaxID=5763 RepID=A0A6A5CBM1_NAEFO|nr:uncharacterized protein FDP41_010966 [Naegleria fowleri]KAF0982988.1 hypothetical protein FDP41_010966 [Naegleria fowleri]CAG4715026.1 unnamed protein product [Naegleria fowleri]
MPTLTSYFTSVNSDNDHLDFIPSSRSRNNILAHRKPSPRRTTSTVTTITTTTSGQSDSPSCSPPPSPHGSSFRGAVSLSINSERFRSKSCSSSPNLSPDSHSASRSKCSSSSGSSGSGFMSVHSPGFQIVYSSSCSSGSIGSTVDNGSMGTTNASSSSSSPSPRILVDGCDKTVKEILKCYHFSFEKFITAGPEFVESFKEYLNLECNLAPFEFFEKVTEFKLLSLPQERTNMAHTIIDNFVKMASDKEINISSSIREMICSEFKSNQSNGDIPLSLFDRALTEVQFSLKNDTFQRYVTSNDFVKLVMHQLQDTTHSPTLIHGNTTLTSTTLRRISTCSEDEDLTFENSIHNFCTLIGNKLSPTPPRGRIISCAHQVPFKYQQHIEHK